MKIHYMQVLACNRSTCIQPRCHQKLEHYLLMALGDLFFVNRTQKDDERDVLRAPLSQNKKIKKAGYEPQAPQKIK